MAFYLSLITNLLCVARVTQPPRDKGGGLVRYCIFFWPPEGREEAPDPMTDEFHHCFRRNLRHMFFR